MIGTDKLKDLLQKRKPRTDSVEEGERSGRTGTDPLLELFENRNALKREYERVHAEYSQLKETSDDLQDRYAEIERQFSGLESMLMDPEHGQNAIVYYRLRAVWDLCRQQLQSLAEDLSARHQKMERERQVQIFQTEKRTRVEDAFARVRAAEADRRAVEEGLKGLEGEMARYTRFWHYFKRKALQGSLDEARTRLQRLAERKKEAEAGLELAKAEEPPEYPGLTLSAKREINISLIALAQYLVLHFNAHTIAEMARNAYVKPVSDVHFGLADECLQMTARIREVISLLRVDSDRSEKLRLRAEYLRAHLRFADDQQAVPEADSVQEIQPAMGGSKSAIDVGAKALPINVIDNGYWGLDEIMLE